MRFNLRNSMKRPRLRKAVAAIATGAVLLGGIGAAGLGGAFEANAVAAPIKLTSCGSVANGTSGGCVVELQKVLNNRINAGLTVDGVFGKNTFNAVVSFQKTRGLAPDGIVGPASKKALYLLTDSCGTIQSGAKGACVTELQRMLNARNNARLTADGSFGQLTKYAVTNFQGAAGLPGDGVAGACTKNKLYGLAVASSCLKTVVSDPAPVNSTTGDLIVAKAKTMVGRYPYVWGGGHKAAPGASTGTCAGAPAGYNCQGTGLDCSGLTRWSIFAATGKDIGQGSAATQMGSNLLKRVGTNKADAKPGDVVFFRSSAGVVNHTAIYAGNGKIYESIPGGYTTTPLGTKNTVVYNTLTSTRIEIYRLK